MDVTIKVRLKKTRGATWHFWTKKWIKRI